MQKRYWREFDGFRAYLALAVFFWHFLGMRGHRDFIVDTANWLPTYFVYGTIAVQLFIILSGFVITSLLYFQKETYSIYIMRRFLRLWPAHITVLLIIFTYYAWYFPEKIAFHSKFLFTEGTFLNGVIPAQLMAESTRLNSPDWSISLEMQYYIIAPFIFAVFAGDNRRRMIGVAILLFFLFLGMPQQWNIYGTQTKLVFLYDSFVGLQIHWFLLGSLCFYLTLTDLKKHVQPALQIAIVAAALGFGRDYEDSTGFAIWCAVFTSVWIGQSWSKILFCNKIALYLGKISYSIYIFHFPIMNIVLHQFRTNFGIDSGPYADAIFFFTCLVLVLAGSSLLHHLIEIPFMNLGRKLKKRWQSAQPVQPQTLSTVR